MLEDTEQLVPSTRGRGRPAVELDLVMLGKLAQLGCTHREIGAALGVSERTIDTRRRDPAFREAMERGEAMGNISLRRKQMDKALKGDNTMLVWLGKQRLGQKDRIETELTGRIEGPPPKLHVNFVSAKALRASDGEAPAER